MGNAIGKTDPNDFPVNRLRRATNRTDLSTTEWAKVSQLQSLQVTKRE